MNLKCLNCGAPQSTAAGTGCQYCGTQLQIPLVKKENTAKDLAIRYEFEVGNYTKVVSLADDYLKEDINNISIWGYKIASEFLNCGAYEYDFLILVNGLEGLLKLNIVENLHLLELEEIFKVSLKKFIKIHRQVYMDSSTLKDFVEFSRISLSPDFNRWLDEIKIEKRLDPLFEGAAIFVVQNQLCKSEIFQRRMKLTIIRTRILLDQLEAEGIIGPERPDKTHEVLFKSEKELNERFKKIFYS